MWELHILQSREVIEKMVSVPNAEEGMPNHLKHLVDLWVSNSIQKWWCHVCLNCGKAIPIVTIRYRANWTFEEMKSENAVGIVCLAGNRSDSLGIGGQGIGRADKSRPDRNQPLGLGQSQVGRTPLLDPVDGPGRARPAFQ